MKFNKTSVSLLCSHICFLFMHRTCWCFLTVNSQKSAFWSSFLLELNITRPKHHQYFCTNLIYEAHVKQICARHTHVINSSRSVTVWYFGTKGHLYFYLQRSTFYKTTFFWGCNIVWSYGNSRFHIVRNITCLFSYEVNEVWRSLDEGGTTPLTFKRTAQDVLLDR